MLAPALKILAMLVFLTMTNSLMR